jgi:hypothetical protein
MTRGVVVLCGLGRELPRDLERIRARQRRVAQTHDLACAARVVGLLLPLERGREILPLCAAAEAVDDEKERRLVARDENLGGHPRSLEPSAKRPEGAVQGEQQEKYERAAEDVGHSC